MKQLNGTASQTVLAPVISCYELLSDVERYPAWHPGVVKSVNVLERGGDGHASRAHATLHVSIGPLVRDFNLVLAVDREPNRSVILTREPNDAGDDEEFRVSWRVTPDGGGTRIGLELDAMLSVPRLLPLGGIGCTMAEGFVGAASAALSRSQ